MTQTDIRGWRHARAGMLKPGDRVICSTLGGVKGTVQWVEQNPDVPGNVIVHYGGHDYECSADAWVCIAAEWAQP